MKKKKLSSIADDDYKNIHHIIKKCLIEKGINDYEIISRSIDVVNNIIIKIVINDELIISRDEIININGKDFKYSF